mmetsp:Transcript_6221/g.16603  ORF Transcript_6221/g.16603 Transcript_6221/m.16603 type:complete len:330 (-) Transcript_6221:135-1124(-)
MSNWQKTSWIPRRLTWSSCRATEATQSEKKSGVRLNCSMLDSTFATTCLSTGMHSCCCCISQGCSSTCAAVRRFSGENFSNWRIRSFGPGETLSQNSPSRENDSSRIRLCCSMRLPEKGGLPQSVACTTMPRLQRSHALVYPLLFFLPQDPITSGAEYVSVPTLDLIGPSAKYLPRPQSMTLTSVLHDSRLQKQMFSSFRSRWAMPLPCTYLSAPATCFVTAATMYSGSLPSSMRRSKRSPPSMYSRASQTTRLSTSHCTSSQRTMWGCRSLPRSWASRSAARRTRSADSPVSWSQETVFRATRCCGRWTSWARSTSPKVPRPRSWRTS